MQANLVVLPGAVAFDFITFANRNPKPCPIVPKPCPIVEVIASAAPEMAITHEPGHMFITDLPADTDPSHELESL